ncbi:MAG TPA: tetratricopeptide repeat protein [Gaiellaceae bacterium]|nr:tetratricopeptide repeat protein [Gaiellaceae bacterium]
MTPSLRIRLLVLALALLAAAIVAGVVYATRQDPVQPKVACRAPARIVPGVPSANVAAVRAAMKRPTREAEKLLEPLAQTDPRDPVVQYNYAASLYCGGYFDEATTAFEQAKKAGPNTWYRVQADLLLHPQFFQQGYPPFTYTGHDPLLVAGQVQQRQFHQVSAEKLWAKAAKEEPTSDVAQVAAAVGRFDMDDLTASFSRLGPLTARFPKSQSVRFHLGLLLAWTGQRDKAVTQFRNALALGAKTELGKESKAFLDGLVPGGTKGAKR